MSAPYYPFISPTTTGGTHTMYPRVYNVVDFQSGTVEAKWWRWIGRSVEVWDGTVLSWLIFAPEIPAGLRGKMFERLAAHIRASVALKRLTTTTERAILCYLLAEEAADDVSP